MATYVKNCSVHASLAANTVDTVTLGAASGIAIAEVKNRDTAAYIYFRLDGTTATVAGDDTYVVGPGESLALEWVGGKSISLISSGTPAYSVTAINGNVN